MSFILKSTRCLKLGKKKSALWRYWRLFFSHSHQYRKLTFSFLAVSIYLLESCHMLQSLCVTYCACPFPATLLINPSLPLSAPESHEMPNIRSADCWQFPGETQIRKRPWALTVKCLSACNSWKYVTARDKILPVGAMLLRGRPAQKLCAEEDCSASSCRDTALVSYLLHHSTFLRWGFTTVWLCSGWSRKLIQLCFS